MPEETPSPPDSHALRWEPDSHPSFPRFIVFEGIDGSGKSTQARLLADRLRKEGLPVLLTSEPSDGPAGTVIKSRVSRLSPLEEVSLFTEDRRDHVERTIIPELRAGKIVICDRYVYSSAAYQGARGLDPETIVAENYAFAPIPDVTFLLEIPVEEGLARIKKGRGNELSVFEVKEVLEKVARIYNELKDAGLVRLNGLASPESIHKEIMSTLNRFGLRSPCPRRDREPRAE